VSGWKEQQNRGEKPDTRKLRLLLVDDEERIIESLSELFRDRYRVLTAGSPDEALERFEEHRPELVLCDQRMPGQTGIELLKRMRDLEPGTIRMLITGYSDIDVVIEAVNAQVLHRYITKPWENEALIEAVEEGARRYLEENGLAGPDAEILF
jgi:response regulator RpfG family c-di-GMP phosphodiesterase